MTRPLVAHLVDSLDEGSGPPRANGELVFDAPWESRAFGLAAALCERGFYEWDEFRRELIASIREWERSPDEQWGYYRHWLASLEALAVEKGLVGRDEVDALAAEIAARPAGHDHDDHDH